MTILSGRLLSLGANLERLLLSRQAGRSIVSFVSVFGNRLRAICLICVFFGGLVSLSLTARAQTPTPAAPPTETDAVQELKKSLNQGIQQVEEVRKKIEEMTKPLQNVLKGVADRDVLVAIDDLLRKSDWRVFWWSQLGMLLGCLLLRAVLLARTFHWARRLWVDVWTTGVLLLGLLVVVPLVTIGEPYRKITKTAWDLYWAK